MVSAQNRLRLRTRVTSAWGHGKAMASQGSSRVTKIRVSWIHDTFKFEECQYNLRNYNDFGETKKAHGIPRLVSRYKNKGFVNSWYFQVWRMSLKPMEFQWFWCVHSMSNFKMSIKPTEFQWFWCVRSMSNFKMLIKPKELQWFLVCQPISQWANESISQSANQPNRDPVVRDQKVLPEVRNRPLLPRDFCRHSTFRICSWSGRGIFGFTHPISDIPMTPSWSLRSFRN